MLLSNMTQHQLVATDQAILRLIPILVNLFVEGADYNQDINPKANFDFLASALANITTHCSSSVRSSFAEPPESASTQSHVARIAVFTEHPSTIRRGGVASIIKWVLMTI